MPRVQSRKIISQITNCEFPNYLASFFPRYLAHWSGAAPNHSQPETSWHKSVTTKYVENRTPFIVESHIGLIILETKWRSFLSDIAVPL